MKFLGQYKRASNYILFTKLPWPRDSEATTTCPPVYHTPLRLHTVTLIAITQLSEVESRTQGHKKRPRTVLPRKNLFEAKDRNARGQGQRPRTEAAIYKFQKFKAPGPDGLYPVLLQKGWNQLKGYSQVIFQECLRHSYVPLAWKEGTDKFLPKPGKKRYFEAKSFRMITLTSFPLKRLEWLILYHINKDNNVQQSFLDRSMDFVQAFLRKLLCMNLCDV